MGYFECLIEDRPMRVNVALQRYIAYKIGRNEVIHLTKVKQGIGKLNLTIGRGGNGYISVWQYSKECRCGEIVAKSTTPISIACFLQELCGNEHLKNNLPLHKWEKDRPRELAKSRF
jgi:hypothetical protein